MTNSGRCYCASNIILAKEDLRGTLQKVREVPMRTVSAKHSKNHLKKEGLCNCFTKTRELKPRTIFLT